MNKRKLHHYWRWIGSSHYWIFFVVFVVSGSIAIYSLRQNNLKMIQLRENVYQADEQNKDVKSALDELRLYIYSHMNTDPAGGDNAIRPPIQLKYSYERLVAKEKARTAEINAKVYKDAQAYCESQNSAFSGRSRVTCIEEYVTKNGVKEQKIR